MTGNLRLPSLTILFGSGAVFAAIGLVFSTTAPVCADNHEGSGEEKDVYSHMEEISDAYRDLRRALRRPDETKIDEYLELVQKMQVGFVISKALEPTQAEGLEGEEKTEMLRQYRAEMTKTIVQLIEVERALLAGDLEAANTALEPVSDLKAEGHEKYQIDD